MAKISSSMGELRVTVQLGQPCSRAATAVAQANAVPQELVLRMGLPQAPTPAPPAIKGLAVMADGDRVGHTGTREGAPSPITCSA